MRCWWSCSTRSDQLWFIWWSFCHSLLFNWIIVCLILLSEMIKSKSCLQLKMITINWFILVEIPSLTFYHSSAVKFAIISFIICFFKFDYFLIENLSLLNFIVFLLSNSLDVHYYLLFLFVSFTKLFPFLISSWLLMVHVHSKVLISRQIICSLLVCSLIFLLYSSVASLLIFVIDYLLTHFVSCRVKWVTYHLST